MNQTELDVEFDQQFDHAGDRWTPALSGVARWQGRIPSGKVTYLIFRNWILPLLDPTSTAEETQAPSDDFPSADILDEINIFNFEDPMAETPYKLCRH
jgi:hypothetical protein